ncbi:hypothetical protein AB0F68_00060 [Micromonospora sp. NPDC023966]|uniref:hypothetical protein n=1 Tax=Micromonospora sp. NPDC023966 TaxID=3154699 RepID=UPI0033DF3527
MGRQRNAAGDTVFFEGDLPPCQWCQIALEEAAEITGANFVYRWVEGGVEQFWWRGPSGR